MRVFIFCGRNIKEILRDPLNLLFGLGLPAALMVLFFVLNQNVAEMPQIFSIQTLGVSITYFGLSFLTLFAGMLIASDIGQAFLVRLRTTPLKTSELLAGYFLSMLPVAAIQIALCFALSALLGMQVTVRLLPAAAALMLNAVFYISLGILFGVLFSSNQVGGISSVIINASAILSGVWFPMETMRGGFRNFCSALPFRHGLILVQTAYSGSGTQTLLHIGYILACTLLFFVLAVQFFKKKTEC